jgi:glutathione S-transferase
MLTLYANGFSPFSRKVAMALEYKGRAYETVDALSHANRERLLAVNPRAEVPVLVLVDGDITVVNSSDIVDYLDRRYPERPISGTGPLRSSRCGRTSRHCARSASRWIPGSIPGYTPGSRRCVATRCLPTTHAARRSS